MREVQPAIDSWLADGKAVALATVIKTWGSAPRRVGAKMAMTPAGDIAGSVSGGCVEGVVYEAAMDVLASGQPQVFRFGVLDETAWGVGLACGGQIEIFVEPLHVPDYRLLASALRDNLHAAVLTIVEGGPGEVGRKLVLVDGQVKTLTLPDDLIGAGHQATEAANQHGSPTLSPLRVEPVALAFVDVLLPAPSLIMVGGVHIAITLSKLAGILGFRTVVIDPRRAFASAERFPHVDRLIHAWPDLAFETTALTISTAVAVLSHDPKIDDPALLRALVSPAFYVGALGSKKTQESRRQRLLAAGLAPAAVDRMRAPIGLDISAQTPEEIALAIMAEIVAVSHGVGR